MRPQGYYAPVRGSLDPVPVDGVGGAVRAAAGPEGTLADACKGAGFEWWYVEAHSAPEAKRQARALRDGTHPDQLDVEFDHAAYRAGLFGPGCAAAFPPGRPL